MNARSFKRNSRRKHSQKSNYKDGHKKSREVSYRINAPLSKVNVRHYNTKQRPLRMPEQPDPFPHSFPDHYLFPNTSLHGSNINLLRRTIALVTAVSVLSMSMPPYARQAEPVETPSLPSDQPDTERDSVWDNLKIPETDDAVIVIPTEEMPPTLPQEDVVWSADVESNFKMFGYYDGTTTVGTPQFDMKMDSRNSVDKKQGFHMWDYDEQMKLNIISCSPSFGDVSEVLTVHLKDGTKIPTIIGEELDPKYLDENNAHIENGAVIMFMVDEATFYRQNRLATRMGDVSYVEGFNSPIVKITKGLDPELQQSISNNEINSGQIFIVPTL